MAITRRSVPLPGLPGLCVSLWAKVFSRHCRDQSGVPGWPQCFRGRNSRIFSTLERIPPAERLERRDCPAGFTLTPIIDSVIEGNAAEYQITLDAPSAIPQSVIVTSEALTAQLGTDYMHQTQRLTFLPGQTTKSFFIQSLIDQRAKAEGPEYVRVFARPVGGTPSELTAIMTINDFAEENNYNIEFEFDPAVSGNLRSLFYSAAERWENIVKGDLPDVFLPNGQIVDDLLIVVNVGDGLPAGTVAEAGIIDIRLGNTGIAADRNFSANGLPYLAQITLSSDDVTDIGIGNVIAHEIGHAIGFGSLWSAPWVDSSGTLVRGVGTYPNLVVNAGPDNPVFIGTNARREYTEIFNRVNVGVPLFNEGVPDDGSYGVHWRDSVFNNYTSANPYGEIMTAEYPVEGINGRIVPYSISLITVGAFDDLGYTVDYAAAEPYVPPMALASGAPVAVPSRNFLAQSNWEADEAVSKSSRVLPARITYPDRSPQILGNDDLSKEVVRASLEAAANNMSGFIDVSHLDQQKRALLAAWAAYEDPVRLSSATSLMTAATDHLLVGGWPDALGPHHPKKLLFASLDIEPAG